LAGDLGVTTPPSLSIELSELVHRLDQIEGHALLHGDPCAGNDIHTTEGVHFIDFEQASLGNGITELAYLRIGFPTCFVAIAPPEVLLVQAENAYRNEWRLLTGTNVRGELADACAGWLIRGETDYLARIPHQDWTWAPLPPGSAFSTAWQLWRKCRLIDPSCRSLCGVANFLRDRMLVRWPALQPLPVHRPPSRNSFIASGSGSQLE
jgi:hypothetical protein